MYVYALIIKKNCMIFSYYLSNGFIKCTIFWLKSTNPFSNAKISWLDLGAVSLDLKRRYKVLRSRSVRRFNSSSKVRKIQNKVMKSSYLSKYGEKNDLRTSALVSKVGRIKKINTYLFGNHGCMGYKRVHIH